MTEKTNTKFAAVDSDGFVVAFYDINIYGDNIPSGAIALSNDAYTDLVNNGQDRAIVDGVVVEKSKPVFFNVEKSITSIRNDKINEGIILGGVEIYADELTQSRIMAARIKAKEDSEYTVNWKTNSGFVLLDADTVIAIADAIHDHVQTCFSAEAAITLADFSDYQSLKDQFDLEYSQL